MTHCPSTRALRLVPLPSLAMVMKAPPASWPFAVSRDQGAVMTSSLLAFSLAAPSGWDCELHAPIERMSAAAPIVASTA